MMDVAGFVVAWASALWWNLGANIIQWSTVVGWTFIMWRVYQMTCHVPWCLRHPAHEVDGTHYKVCHVHHTAKHHHFLQERFKKHLEQHPDQLTHGEST